MKSAWIALIEVECTWWATDQIKLFDIWISSWSKDEFPLGLDYCSLFLWVSQVSWEHRRLYLAIFSSLIDRSWWLRLFGRTDRCKCHKAHKSSRHPSPERSKLRILCTASGFPKPPIPDKIQGGKRMACSNQGINTTLRTSILIPPLKHQ